MFHTLTTLNLLWPPCMAHSQDSPQAHQPLRMCGTQVDPALIHGAKDVCLSQLCPRPPQLPCWGWVGKGEAGGPVRDLFKGLGGRWLSRRALYHSSLHHRPASL